MMSRGSSAASLLLWALVASSAAGCAGGSQAAARSEVGPLKDTQAGLQATQAHMDSYTDTVMQHQAQDPSSSSPPAGEQPRLQEVQQVLIPADGLIGGEGATDGENKGDNGESNKGKHNPDDAQLGSAAGHPAQRPVESPVAPPVEPLNYPPPTPGCAAAYSGNGCDVPRLLPCFGEGFAAKDGWTLNRMGATGAARREEAAGEAAQAEGDVLHKWTPKDHSHPPLEGETLLAKLPPLPFTGERQAPFQSCALIGNSPSLLDKPWGAEIDKHDLVARCNNAPTKGFEEHTGSWTSFRYQNERYSGWVEAAGEPTIGRYCSPVGTYGMVNCMGSKFWSLSLRSPELNFMLQKKMHPLNPGLDDWIERPFRQNKTMPSTGMRALGVMLHLCERVDMYGFGGANVQGYRVWYWEKYKGFKGKPPQDILHKKFPKMLKRGWLRDKWTYAGEQRYSAPVGATGAPGDGGAAGNGGSSRRRLLKEKVTGARLLKGKVTDARLLKGRVTGARLKGKITGTQLLNGKVVGTRLLKGKVTGTHLLKGKVIASEHSRGFEEQCLEALASAGAVRVMR